MKKRLILFIMVCTVWLNGVDGHSVGGGDIDLLQRSGVFSSNPAQLGLYPHSSVGVGYNFFTIREYEMVSHFDKIKPNLSTLLTQKIAEDDMQKMEKEALLARQGMTAYNGLYALSQKDDFFYFNQPFFSLGLQFRNIGFSIEQDTTLGAFTNIDNLLGIPSPKDIGDNGSNYNFWKSYWETLLKTDGNHLMIKDINLMKYGLSYANRVAMGIGDVYMGAKVKLIQAKLRVEKRDILDMELDDLQEFLTTSHNFSDYTKQERLTADVGLIFQPKDSPFTIGWVLKNYNSPTFSNAEHNTSESNASKTQEQFMQDQFIQDQFIMDKQSQISLAYRQDDATYGVKVDLSPHKDLINNQWLQYFDIGISFAVDETSTMQVGMKSSLLSGLLERAIFTVGFETIYRDMHFSIGYQWSDHFISGQTTYKQENRLAGSVYYEL